MPRIRATTPLQNWYVFATTQNPSYGFGVDATPHPKGRYYNRLMLNVHGPVYPNHQKKRALIAGEVDIYAEDGLLEKKPSADSRSSVGLVQIRTDSTIGFALWLPPLDVVFLTSILETNGQSTPVLILRSEELKWRKASLWGIEVESSFNPHDWEGETLHDWMLDQGLTGPVSGETNQ